MGRSSPSATPTAPDFRPIGGPLVYLVVAAAGLYTVGIAFQLYAVVT